jgi:AraC-like DNA-binding protein
MRRLVWSTDDVPEAERFSYWRDEALALVGVTCEAPDQENPFNGKAESWIGESVARFRYSAGGYRAIRRGSDIACRGWADQIWLRRESGAGARFDHSGRELILGPGDLSVVDPTIPFADEPRTSNDGDILVIPRRFFEPHLPVSRHPRSFGLTGSSGIAGLVKTYLDAFTGQIDTLDEREIALVADNFGRLLAVACGAAAGEHKDAVRLARLEEAKRYVDLNVADPDLTPEKAAAALRMSLRQLHRCFEPSGTSFSQYVIGRRLAECRAALMNPIGGRPVTDIAFAWGFSSLTTFYGAFQRQFGIAPGELRRTAGSRDAASPDRAIRAH